VSFPGWWTVPSVRPAIRPHDSGPKYIFFNMIRRVLGAEPIRRPLALVARALDFCRHEQMIAEYRTEYEVAQSFEFQGRSTKLSGSGNIRIGEHGHVSGGAHFHAYHGTTVEIGDFVRIGSNVTMQTVNYAPDQEFQRPESAVSYQTGDIQVGDGVWIGNNVFIVEGTTIGSDSVVAANAVVSDDVPSGVVAGGVPARTIRERMQRSG